MFVLYIIKFLPEDTKFKFKPQLYKKKEAESTILPLFNIYT